MTEVHTIDRAGSGAADPLGIFRGVRVVIVAPKAPPVTGMSVQSAALASHLTAEGAVPHLVATNPVVPAALTAVPAVAAAWRRRTFLADLRAAISARAGVLHVHGASGDYFREIVAPSLAEARDAGMRTVLRWDGPDLDGFLAEHFEKVAAEFLLADEIVVPSGYLAGIVRARLGRDARILPNLVEETGTDRPPVRREGPLRLISLRPLTRVNGVDVALRAVAAAAAKGADLRFTIVGDGPERRALEDLAATLPAGTIRFTGAVPREQVPALIADADAVVNGSWYDNFPLAIAEPLAHGLPVATTDAGGLRWLVQHGRTGLVTPAGDVDALADSVAALARDHALVEDLGWRAKVEALRWTWPAVRDEWARAYGV